jgi:hypothetical protein
MLHIIVDAPHTEEVVAAQNFYTKQWWQMNLMHAINGADGIAQFLAQQHHFPQGNWYIASPIHWEATHNDAMIVYDAKTGEDESQLAHFFQVFQGFLERDDCPVQKLDLSVWLFDAKNLIDFKLPSLNAVMHRSLQDYLRDMPSGWRTWFTEVQMLFHAASPNATSIINGVWPWGGGKFSIVTEIYRFGEFSGIESKAWTPSMQLPTQGVLLIAQAHKEEFLALFDKKYSNHMPVTWWWQNKMYQTQPQSLWKKLQSWFRYAN